MKHNNLSNFCLVTLLASTISLSLCADEISSESREALIDRARSVALALKDSENYYDKITGAGTLVELGDKEALRFIAESLGQNDWVLLRSAIDTLLSVQHPSGTDVVYRAAETINDRVFLKFLAESLTHKAREDMSGFLIDLLEEDDQWVKKHAMQALDFIEFENKKKILSDLASSEERDKVIRAYAYMGLVKRDATAEEIENIIKIAKEWDSSAKEAAAVALGRVDSKRSREVLRELRNSRYPKVSIAALASEVGFGLEDSRDRLIEIIVSGKGLDPSVAAASLRRMPRDVSESLTRELIECCEISSDVGTRLLEAWSNISSIPADIYKWGLTNDNPDIRLQGIWLVGYTAASEYLNEIVMFLDDDDSGIRGMAAWSIVRLLLQ